METYKLLEELVNLHDSVTVTYLSKHMLGCKFVYGASVESVEEQIAAYADSLGIEVDYYFAKKFEISKTDDRITLIYRA